MDASGIVTSVQILSGNEHEGEHLSELLEQDVRKGHRFTSVVADKGYESIGNRNTIRNHGAKPEIPSRNAGILAKTRFRYRPRKDTCVPRAEGDERKNFFQRRVSVLLFTNRLPKMPIENRVSGKEGNPKASVPQRPGSGLTSEPAKFTASIARPEGHRTHIWRAETMARPGTRTLPRQVACSHPSVSHVFGFERETNRQPDPGSIIKTCSCFVMCQRWSMESIYGHTNQPPHALFNHRYPTTRISDWLP